MFSVWDILRVDDDDNADTGVSINSPARDIYQVILNIGEWHES